MSFERALATAKSQVEAYVTSHLSGIPGPISDASLYAVTGGKCLRGFLVLESARLHEIDPIKAQSAAAAIECLHAYSLVHDDMPCMDNDDLRRGQPTVHRKWDDATAVLAGDALQALAFEFVAKTDCADAARVALITSLAQAAGMQGMVGGQALDIAAETSATPLTLTEVETLQAGKTGALITWSALAGARMAAADQSPLQTYGDALGLAFQIADDILDIEGDAATVGKAVQKDAKAGKATFVSLLGLEGAKSRANALVSQACDALFPFGDRAETLRQAARFVIARDK